MFYDVGKSAHLFRLTDGIIPLRHGTRGFLNKNIIDIIEIFIISRVIVLIKHLSINH